MKSGQLIEYNKRNTFLQKSCVNIIKREKNRWFLKIIIDFALLRVTPIPSPTLFLIDNIKLNSYQFCIDKGDGPRP